MTKIAGWNHKLLNILWRFDIKTWKRCRLFVEMELSGQRPLEIYDYLMRTRNNPNKWVLDMIHRNSIAELNKKSFQNVLSRLTQSVESFICYRELKKEPQQKNTLLRQYYLRHSDYKEWENNFYKALDRYNKQETVSFHDQFDLIRILHQSYFNTHPIKKAYSIDILRRLRQLSQSTQEEYQSYVDIVLNYTEIATKNPQLLLPLQSKATLNTELFHDINSLMKKYNSDLAEDIILRFDSIGPSIDLEIRIVISGLLREILLAQLLREGQNKTAELAVKVMFKELEYMEEKEIPINPGKIYRLINCLNYIGDIDSMEMILNKYESQMAGKDVYEISQAHLLIAKNMVAEAITRLLNIQAYKFKTKQRVKTALIRAYSQYYDQPEFCLSEIKKYKNWIKANNTLLSEIVQIGTTRSVNILEEILKNHDVTLILNKIHEKRPLSSRRWLLKEVERRYQIDTSSSFSQ